MNCIYLNPSTLFPASLLPPLTAGERLLHQLDGCSGRFEKGTVYLGNVHHALTTVIFTFWFMSIMNTMP